MNEGLMLMLCIGAEFLVFEHGGRIDLVVGRMVGVRFVLI